MDDAQNEVVEQQQPTEQQATQEQQVHETKPQEGGEQHQETATQEQETQQQRDDAGRFQKKEGVQSRIDELTRQRRESEREAAYWKQVAAGAQTPAQAAPQRPVPENFSKYDDYIDALTDWKTEQALNKRMAAESDRKVAETRQQTFVERQTQFRQQTADYDEVVGNSTTPLTKHVAEVLQESDLGPQLAYHFAKNPDVLVRLNDMSPTAAAREIGRLEATFAKPTQAAAPTKKVTQTPAPAGTQSSSQGRSTQADPSKMSQEEYKEWRRKQGARW